MKGNYIAKNMNLVNKNSVHKSLKDSYMEDEASWIEEGIEQYNLEKQEMLNEQSAKKFRSNSD